MKVTYTNEYWKYLTLNVYKANENASVKPNFFNKIKWKLSQSQNSAI